MDIKRYAELKANSNMYLQKIEGIVHVVKKNYDPDSGDPGNPTVLPIDKVSFLKHKEVAQKMVDAVALFLDDVDAKEKEE